MWTRLLIISAFCSVAVWAAATKSSRPSPCAPGTSYAKDCNACQCGATPMKDKCSQRDCNRLSAAATSTSKPATGVYPGSCPTLVTAAPGSNSCKNRSPSSSNCAKDTDCPGAKKCCKDGCDRFLCRNAIYNQTQIQG